MDDELLKRCDELLKAASEHYDKADEKAAAMEKFSEICARHNMCPICGNMVFMLAGNAMAFSHTIGADTVKLVFVEDDKEICVTLGLADVTALTRELLLLALS